MESVLDTYERKYDPKNPVICLDERPCQLIDDVISPLPMEPGKTRKEDYHYKRNGMCVVFLALEPLTGKRIVEVSQRKTKEDYTRFMSKVANQYDEADKITVVQDNLNTHNPSSFYENLLADEACELTKRFEMIYTPKKASWLNMAEIEFSVLSKQCLNRRIGDLQTMIKEVEAWTKKRNEDEVKINWQFTKNEAREKLQRKYFNVLLEEKKDKKSNNKLVKKKNNKEEALAS